MSQSNQDDLDHLLGYCDCLPPHYVYGNTTEDIKQALNQWANDREAKAYEKGVLIGNVEGQEEAAKRANDRVVAELEIMANRPYFTSQSRPQDIPRDELQKYVKDRIKQLKGNKSSISSTNETLQEGNKVDE